MHYRTLGPARLVVACAVAALVLSSGSAQASSPEAVDPAGDATLVLSHCQLVLIAGVPCTAMPGSEPSIDIVEVDLSTDGDDLLVATTVVDLDAPSALGPVATRRFLTSTTAGGYTIHVEGDFGATTGELRVYGRDRGAVAAVPMASDAATNTVTFRVPLATLEQAASSTCDACGSIGRGSVVQGVNAQTWLSSALTSNGGLGASDYAFGDAQYRIGTP